VLTHKDRLLHFDWELILALWEIQNIDIVINKGDPPTFEEELAQDVIEIITYSAPGSEAGRDHNAALNLARLAAVLR